MTIHPQVCTIPKIRAEIQALTHFSSEFAQGFSVAQQTTDKSHCPQHLQTTLSKAQEMIGVELRKMLFLSLDDLLIVTCEFIHPAALQSGSKPCLETLWSFKSS